MNDKPTPIEEIVALSQVLGEPDRDFVVLAEGNTSIRSRSGRFLVKRSGSTLAQCDAHDFVELDLDMVLSRLSTEEATVDAGSRLLADATVGHGRASVEALLHAVCLEYESVRVVGHTHPEGVLALLCTDRADLLVTAPMFPDQVVVLGLNPLLIPYVDPGLPLARLVREALREHVAKIGALPRAIYLRNHGMFALGASPSEVLAITTMAQKVSRVILRASSAVTLVPLESGQAAAIELRPDELYRRRQLGRADPDNSSVKRPSTD